MLITQTRYRTRAVELDITLTSIFVSLVQFVLVQFFLILGSPVQLQWLVVMWSPMASYNLIVEFFLPLNFTRLTYK